MNDMIDTHRERILNFMQIPHEQITKRRNKGEGSANNNINTHTRPHHLKIHAIKIEQKSFESDALKHSFFSYLFISHCFFVAAFYIVPMVLVPIACSFSFKPFA